MDNLERLNEIKKKVAALSQELESFRNGLDNDIKAPINLSGDLLNDIQQLLGIQHDLIYFTLRNDQNSLKNTFDKLKKYEDYED